MASYRQFKAGDGSIWVEVVETQAAGGGQVNVGDLRDLLKPLRDISTIVAAQIDNAPEGSRPGEVEVSFAIASLDDGRIAIALEDKANIWVRIAWKASSDGSLPLSGLMPTFEP